MSGYDDMEVCPCCKMLYGCYCHEHPHEDNPLCPGTTAAIIRWVNSEEGKQALKDAAERAKEFSKWYREAARVTPEQMQRRMTI